MAVCARTLQRWGVWTLVLLGWFDAGRNGADNVRFGGDLTTDEQVNDDDIVLLYDGHNHSNGLVSSSIAEALS